MKLLVLSNGKGEDVLAATLIAALVKERELSGKAAPQVTALPLIGDGSAYTKAGIATIGRGLSLPSRGFIGSPLALLRDVRAGLIGKLFERITALRKASKDVDHLICVGDIVPVLLATLFTKRPAIHVSTAVTVRFRKFGPLEMAVLKRCELVFAKDMQTAEFLSSRGVKARFSGNLMIDDRNLAGSGTSYGDGRSDVVALIPSTRDDAYDNIRRMIRISSLLGGANINLVLPFPESLSEEKLGGIVRDMGIKISASSEKDALWKAEVGRGVALLAVKGHFADVLRSSKAAMGMTGTGNEQAAGLGVPLILIEEGSSASGTRLRFYEKLLEGSVLPLRGTDERIASGIRELLRDGERLRRMSDAGKRTIGEPGAARRMAGEMLRILDA